MSQELSYCEKLAQKRTDFVMKSMDQWLMLNKWSKKQDLEDLGKPENCSAMVIFLSASNRNIYIYENIIEMKCNALKNFDKSNVQLIINEVFYIFKIISSSLKDIFY